MGTEYPSTMEADRVGECNFSLNSQSFKSHDGWTGGIPLHEMILFYEGIPLRARRRNHPPSLGFSLSLTIDVLVWVVLFQAHAMCCSTIHGCSWGTAYIFACCVLVVEIQPLNC